MNFDLSEEQEILKKTVRDFAEREILPYRMEWDEKQEFPLKAIKKLGEMGFMGVIFPEKYGGSGMSYIDYVIIVEELSRVDGSIGISIAAHNSLCSNHIYIAATEEQKMKYLVPLARGERIGAWALTEPSSGSDASALRTYAKKVKDGFILNGTKNFTTHGSVGDIIVVMARTGDSSNEKHNITAFIVEKGTVGFRVGKKENKLGLRASDTAEIIFEDCFIPDCQVLGKVGHGFRDALKVLDGGRISIASLSLGVAQGAYETALNYSKEREAFGKKICSFEAIQWILADMATKIEAARILTFESAWRKDNNMNVTKYSSMAKYYASEVSVWVSERAVQVLGGYGFIKDFPAEKFYRDCKLNTIGEGTSEIQKVIIARCILEEFGAK